MKRPIVWANIFLTLGILLGQSDTCRTVVFLFAAAGLCACLYMKYKYWPVFLFLLFSLAGAARVRDSLKNPLDGQPLYARAGQLAWV